MWGETAGARPNVLRKERLVASTRRADNMLAGGESIDRDLLPAVPQGENWGLQHERSGQ